LSSSGAGTSPSSRDGGIITLVAPDGQNIILVTPSLCRWCPHQDGIGALKAWAVFAVIMMAIVDHCHASMANLW
jgi:hypothetical protein